jgi:D-alanine-D-alanine ligase
VTGRLRVLVVGGGQSCEHDVSLASAEAVAGALDRARFDVDRLTIGRDGKWSADDQTPLSGGLGEAVARIQSADVVFPALHGPRGEDGTFAALCELAGTPYVGCGVGAGALAMDKAATKLVAEGLGITTARGTVVTRASRGQPIAKATVVPPVVVKPVSAGSSYGVALARTAEDVLAGVDAALRIDDRVIVEEAIAGREVDVAVIERPDGRLFAGPPLEILLSDRALFDTDNKYDGSAQFRIPADISRGDASALTEASIAMFEALGCSGLARFDFFVTGDGVVLNEVNTMPGMTEHSQLPRMFAAVGLPYPELLETLIETALATAATAA